MIDLEAIEVRASKASCGPWESRVSRSTRWPVYIATNDGGLGLGFFAPADAQFIAHARQDVPALISEVRRLRELIQEVIEHDETTAWGQNKLAAALAGRGG